MSKDKLLNSIFKRIKSKNKKVKDEKEIDIHEDFKGQYFEINIERFEDIEKFFMANIQKQMEGSKYFTNSEMEITFTNHNNIHILNEEDKLLLVAYFDPELFSRKELQIFHDYLEENEFFNNDDDRFDDEQVQIYQKLFSFQESEDLLDKMVDIFNYLNSEPYDPNIAFSLLFGEVKK